MSQKLFVGNLPFSATESDLKDFFEYRKHPVAEVKIMTDRETGRARGFGFVTLQDGVDADAVVDDMNARKMEGRALTVNIAKPMPPREPQQHGRREPRW